MRLINLFLFNIFILTALLMIVNCTKDNPIKTPPPKTTTANDSAAYISWKPANIFIIAEPSYPMSLGSDTLNPILVFLSMTYVDNNNRSFTIFKGSALGTGYFPLQIFTYGSSCPYSWLMTLPMFGSSPFYFCFSPGQDIYGPTYSQAMSLRIDLSFEGNFKLRLCYDPNLPSASAVLSQCLTIDTLSSSNIRRFKSDSLYICANTGATRDSVYAKSRRTYSYTLYFN